VLQSKEYDTLGHSINKIIISFSYHTTVQNRKNFAARQDFKMENN
jgi:hypothetical protein